MLVYPMPSLIIINLTSPSTQLADDGRAVASSMGE
jgi:hypothetical protein